jgi:uncharacterized membrane protein
MNNMMLWVTLICNVMVVFAFSITPFVARKTELFGVSLPSAEIDRPELSAFRRSYLLMTLVSGAVLIVLTIMLFYLTQNEMTQIKWFLILLFVYIGVDFLIYLFFHRKMKAFKATQQWQAFGSAENAGTSNVHADSEKDQEEDVKPVLVIDTEPPKREVLHPAWLLLFVAVGIGTLIYLWYLWPSLPDRIPIHMNAAGNIDGWVDKGAGGFVTMLFSQWIIIGVFILVYLMIPLTKRQIDVAKPLESQEQGRRFRYTMSACMVFCGAALAAVLGFLPLAMAQEKSGAMFTIIPLILVFAVIAVMFVVIFRTGQGGSRLKVVEGQKDISFSGKRLENTDDDMYWKLGQFYFNPDDPTIFVEKRFGIGWTMNFGHPVSWISLIGRIVVVIISLVLAFSA